jgi:heme/copper-type cytochrome/quinol oxidase subunit 2
LDIGWLRDLIIIVTGVIEIILLIMLGILGWSLYKRIQELSQSAKKLTISVQGVVDSAKVTASNFASVSTFARSEIAEPLIKTAAVVQGVSAGLSTIMDFFQRKRR